MSMETVKRLAALAGDDVVHTLQSDMDFLERFAALVASEAGEVMRERCCRKAGSMERDYPITGKLYAGNVSKAIRALPGVTLEDIK